MLMEWTGPHAGPWFLIFPLLWLAVVVFAIWAFRGGWRRSRWERDTAGAILGERFAKGEISAEEYRERLAVLEGRRR
jgi:putative membrane protein